MVRDTAKRNQNLYYHYHQEQRHTTEDCRNMWDHLDQLIREEKPKSLLHHSSGQGNASLAPPLGIINVIFAASGRTGSQPAKVMSVA